MLQLLQNTPCLFTQKKKENVHKGLRERMASDLVCMKKDFLCTKLQSTLQRDAEATSISDVVETLK